jgi:hypothetical protein
MVVACDTILDVKAFSSSDQQAELRNALRVALTHVFMSPCSFVSVFDQTPEQAMAALKNKPDTFGKLRGYLGATTLKKNVTRVLKLAQQLHASYAGPPREDK